MATIVRQNMISRTRTATKHARVGRTGQSKEVIARPIARSLQRRNIGPTGTRRPTESKSHQRQSDCAHIAEFHHVTHHLAVLFPLLAVLGDWERFLGLDPPIKRDKAIGVAQMEPACSQLRNGLA
jgi:hypothetical protein